MVSPAGVMQALIIDEYGGPGVVQLRAVDVPVAGAGQVLVRVAAAGINFMDIGTREGRYAQSRSYDVRLPCILGMEGAGEVVAVGNGVSRLAVGDRVAWCISWGSFAEFACVPEALAAKIPDEVGFEIAAATMFQGCTAHYLVNDVARLHEGSTCLVHAAAGAIGQLLVQMAKSIGARVIATASTELKRDIASKRGADTVLPYGDGAFADRVRELTNGVGVDVVFDAVGSTTLRHSFRATRRSGLVVNYGSVSGPVIDLDPLELGEAGSLFLTRPRLSDHMLDAETVQRRADSIFAAIVRGTLSVEVAERYRLPEVPVAHAKLVAREQIGKPIVCLQGR